MAIEGARAKAANEIDRYSKIRPIIVNNKTLIEAELNRRGKGRGPPPHIVIDRLLKEIKEPRKQKKRSPDNRKPSLQNSQSRPTFKRRSPSKTKKSKSPAKA